MLSFFVLFVNECLERLVSWQKTTQEKGYDINTMFVFILDNASSMNEMDWRLYYELINQNHPRFQSLAILANIDRERQFIRPLWTN